MTETIDRAAQNGTVDITVKPVEQTEAEKELADLRATWDRLGVTPVDYLRLRSTITELRIAEGQMRRTVEWLTTTCREAEKSLNTAKMDFELERIRRQRRSRLGDNIAFGLFTFAIAAWFVLMVISADTTEKRVALLAGIGLSAVLFAIGAGGSWLIEKMVKAIKARRTSEPESTKTV